MSLFSNSPTTLEFKVHRRPPEVVVPSKPTPYEFKSLSDMESLNFYKMYVTGVSFYHPNPSKSGIDPVEAIRKAISEALVFYYPYAGRMREGCSGRLLVECNGEGVLFCEADADVTLDEFCYPLVPPFPYLDKLAFDVPDSNEILNCPLLFFQVTRLKCGGFIFGLRYNHTMSDAHGLIQFLSAVGEMARGVAFPSVLPIWERHLLNYKDPHQLQSQLLGSASDEKAPLERDLCHRVLYFGESEIHALKKCIPDHLHHCSSFEVVTAFIWKCRVTSYQPHPTEKMSLIWPINLRYKFKHIVPSGYYGNATPLVVATSSAKEIIENPISYALQVVINANKEKTFEDYIQSFITLKVDRWSYSVTDLRYAGFEKVDFGWGEAIFGGPAHIGSEFGICFPFKAENGEKGMIIPICLPKQVMERFEEELKDMLKNQQLSEIKSKL